MMQNTLREYRERAGLSQAELARRVRVASPNISAIEAGRTMAWPRLRKAIIKTLSRALGLNLSEKDVFPETVVNGQTRS